MPVSRSKWRDFQLVRFEPSLWNRVLRQQPTIPDANGRCRPRVSCQLEKNGVARQRKSNYTKSRKV